MKSAALRAVESQVESALAGRVLSPFGVRPPRQPETFPTGIAQVDAVTGGVPRGALTEIYGPASSGRTSLLLSLVAQVTTKEEVCAVVDATDAFNPEIAAAAGVELGRMLWVRCGSSVSSFSFLVSREELPWASVEKLETRNKKLTSVERALKVTDLLLQAGGFGMIVVDLGDVPPRTARRVPLTSWFRFRRAVEDTPTALVVVEQEAFAKSCAGLEIKLSAFSTQPSAHATSRPTHTRLLRQLKVEVEVHSRVMRKPVRSTVATFTADASWAG